MQVFYLGRAPRTKGTLPDFLKWRRVTRHPLVFRRLTGSQRTPEFGLSQRRVKISEKGSKSIKMDEVRNSGGARIKILGDANLKPPYFVTRELVSFVSLYYIRIKIFKNI